MQRPRAVVFDLFNTLVPGGTRAERDRVSRRMADALGVDPRALADLVRDTFDDRTRGRLGDLHATVTWLARRLGVDPPRDDVAVAVQLRLEMTRGLHDRTWALPVLGQLRDAGLACALVSDCSAETPEVWSTSPLAPYFDALSFSCQTGHRKPEPAAYLAALGELGLAPQECLYVGDGGSHELGGARNVGMRVVQCLPPDSTRSEAIDAEVGWTGEVVTDLSDLLSILA